MGRHNNICDSHIMEVIIGVMRQSDISFPDKTILEISFLSKEHFYDISVKSNNYLIIGGDKDIADNLIGIAEDEKIYYIDGDNLCYIAVNIGVFIKELLLFDSYMNMKADNLPENPDDETLSEFTDNFKSRIIELDNTAFNSDNTFWSEICEEMEYGIII